MEIKVSEETLKNIEKVSKKLGLSKNEIIVRAIKLYFYSAKELVNLKEELETWEEASLEDSSNFLQKYNL